MRAIRITLSLLLCCAVVMQGCEEPTAPASDLTQSSIGPDGGTITSSDDRLRLTIPPGALTDTVEIGILSVTSTGLAPAMRYELTPEGMQFELPVQLSVDVDDFVELDDEGDRGIPFLSTTDAQGNNPEVARNHKLSIDVSSGEATLEAEISHFSELTIDYTGLDVFVSSIPATHPANTALPPVTARIRGRFEYVVVLNATYQDISAGELFYTDSNPATFPDFAGTGVTEINASYTCGDAGLGEYLSLINITMFYDWASLEASLAPSTNFTTRLGTTNIGGFNGSNVFGGNATVGADSGDSETSESSESVTYFDYTISATALVQCQAGSGSSGPGGSGVDPGRPDKSQGTYVGNGACQIGTMTLGVTNEGNITVSPLGSENPGTSTFAPQDDSEDTYDSVRTDLSFFESDGHSCTLTCGPGEFDITVECTGPEGSCTETLTFQGF